LKQKNVDGKEIAGLLNGEVVGDGASQIHNVSSIETAKEGELAFAFSKEHLRIPSFLLENHFINHNFCSATPFSPKFFSKTLKIDLFTCCSFKEKSAMSSNFKYLFFPLKVGGIGFRDFFFSLINHQPLQFFRNPCQIK